jgi:hypothetical protein
MHSCVCGSTTAHTHRPSGVSTALKNKSLFILRLIYFREIVCIWLGRRGYIFGRDRLRFRRLYHDVVLVDNTLQRPGSRETNTGRSYCFRKFRILSLSTLVSNALLCICIPMVSHCSAEKAFGGGVLWQR